MEGQVDNKQGGQADKNADNQKGRSDEQITLTPLLEFPLGRTFTLCCGNRRLCIFNHIGSSKLCGPEQDAPGRGILYVFSSDMNAIR